MVKNCRLFCFILIGVVMMSGCNSPPPVMLPMDKYQYGSLYMRQMNYVLNDKLILAWEKKLQKDGVSIVSVGQEYKLVMPTSLLFYGDSPRIQWNSYAMLNDIASYLRCFNKIEVKIAGITRATGNPERDQALSFNRARNVENYFWGQEIGANLIYIRGYVVPGQPGRLEISFRSVMM